MNPREDRGLAIAKSGSITENLDGSFSVPSQTVGEIAYRVVPLDGSYRCNCPDYAQRHEEVGECKHAHAIRFWIAARVELQEQPKPRVFSEDATQCPKCGSIRVVKFGNYNGKQLYKCKDCKTKFREGLIQKARYSPETITLTLDLYFSGLSLRKIARTLNDHFGLTLGATTIYDWVQKFVPMVGYYVDSLAPQVSADWHADELFVSMKNGQKIAKKGKGEYTIAYLWNVMDRKTRFLLASKLSTYRDTMGADRALREAMSNAKGSQPQRLFTDALPAYKMALAGFPEAGRPQHIAKAGIKKPHANNNRIERMNGTLRERVKVQRGWKSYRTPFAEGQKIHYNFVKPHSALAGQTPAQMAGVGVSGNKWLELLKEAITLYRTEVEKHP